MTWFPLRNLCGSAALRLCGKYFILGASTPQSRRERRGYVEAYCLRCRAASNNKTPAATDTFKLSAAPFIGMLTR